MRPTCPLLALSVLVGGAACEPAPTAKAEPTWAEDVLPIVRGNCLSCHGGAPVQCADGNPDAGIKSVLARCQPPDAVKPVFRLDTFESANHVLVFDESKPDPVYDATYAGRHVVPVAGATAATRFTIRLFDDWEGREYAGL